MEELIVGCVRHIDAKRPIRDPIGPFVSKGCYYVKMGNSIVSRHEWEETIQPDCKVTMYMVPEYLTSYAGPSPVHIQNRTRPRKTRALPRPLMLALPEKIIVVGGEDEGKGKRKEGRPWGVTPLDLLLMGRPWPWAHDRSINKKSSKA